MLAIPDSEVPERLSTRERLRATLGERGMAILLAIAIELLLALLLLTMVPGLRPKEKTPPIFGFDIDSGEAVAPKNEADVKDKPKGGSGEKTKAPVPRPPDEITPPPTVPEAPAPPANVLWLSRKDYASSDIDKVRPQGNESASNDAAIGPGSGRGSAGDSARAEGHGPNGEPLYAAEWYRRPTHAELSPYIPARARDGGWGLIACRTAPNFRVEDCVELGDAPRGSGLAGAVRQAAFQFRVRPPRVGGKSQVGAWVSIRIDYTVTRE